MFTQTERKGRDTEQLIRLRILNIQRQLEDLEKLATEYSKSKFTSHNLVNDLKNQLRKKLEEAAKQTDLLIKQNNDIDLTADLASLSEINNKILVAQRSLAEVNEGLLQTQDKINSCHKEIHEESQKLELIVRKKINRVLMTIRPPTMQESHPLSKRYPQNTALLDLDHAHVSNQKRASLSTQKRFWSELKVPSAESQQKKKRKTKQVPKPQPPIQLATFPLTQHVSHAVNTHSPDTTNPHASSSIANLISTEGMQKLDEFLETHAEENNKASTPPQPYLTQQPEFVGNSFYSTQLPLWLTPHPISNSRQVISRSAFQPVATSATAEEDYPTATADNASPDFQTISPQSIDEYFRNNKEELTELGRSNHL